MALRSEPLMGSETVAWWADLWGYAMAALREPESGLLSEGNLESSCGWLEDMKDVQSDCELECTKESVLRLSGRQ